ncbi:MAG: hypothetical protein CMJ64_27605 [Planctomycetaceae bacterium]|nr:hypothetical protein [Planctomycetaceae bacterium]
MHRQGSIIFVGIEPKDRQLKTVLTFRLAVTAGRIAGELAEYRNDIVLEVETASGLFRGAKWRRETTNGNQKRGGKSSRMVRAQAYRAANAGTHQRILM